MIFFLDLYVCVAIFYMDSVPFRSYWSCCYEFCVASFLFRTYSTFVMLLKCLICSWSNSDNWLGWYKWEHDSLNPLTARTMYSTNIYLDSLNVDDNGGNSSNDGSDDGNTRSLLHIMIAYSRFATVSVCVRLDLSQCDGCISWKVLLPLTVQQIS